MATAFSDLEFVPHSNWPGVMARHEFENGYSASVIQSPYSYGGDQGLYELAVIHDGKLCYDTPITNDVLGHLTEDDVTRLLGEVAALPAVQPA